MAVLKMAAEVLSALRARLLPPGAECEEAAFLFTRPADASAGALELVGWRAIPPEGFEARSPYYLELTDHTRASVIKEAHDLGAGLIEAHSHPMQRRACFSWSDLHGFDEFVPHVLWRLPGRIYGALVLAPDSFDAIIWPERGAPPMALEGVHAGGTLHRPTGLTMAHWRDIYDTQPV